MRSTCVQMRRLDCSTNGRVAGAIRMYTSSLRYFKKYSMQVFTRQLAVIFNRILLSRSKTSRQRENSQKCAVRISSALHPSICFSVLTGTGLSGGRHSRQHRSAQHTASGISGYHSRIQSLPLKTCARPPMPSDWALCTSVLS